MTDELALSAGDLATLLGVPIGTIWYWAHEDKWRRTKTRPTRYSADDAQASYDRRRYPAGLPDAPSPRSPSQDSPCPP